MPSKETKTLESNEYLKSDKTQFIIYANLECIIKEIDGCKSIFIFHQLFYYLQCHHLKPWKKA